MIEDSEMAFRLEAMKREQEARRQKLQQNVSMKMNKLKESAGIAAEKIRLLNQELQILRLEFQIEETQLDAPREYKQKIDVYKEYCWCCFCPTNSYVKEEEIDVSSVGMKEFFHVKNMDDYEIKLEKIRKRSQQLHSYGWYGCNQVSQSLESCLGVFKFLGILFCPILCLNYFCYHCYAGGKNCYYRYGSRTHKIYRTYSGFQKCGSFASISNKNTKKIEELRKVLTKQKEIQKMMFNQNSNLIEILNNQLECLKLEYENEDLNDKQQYETVQRGRSTALCGCITLELDTFEIEQATSQALSSYFKVDNHVDFFQKLDRLKSTDRRLKTCRNQCCIGFADHTVGSALRDLQFGSLGERNSAWVWIVPPIEICLSPCLLTYSCCEACCDGCYRRRCRTHQLYQIYSSYNILSRPQ